MYLILDEKPHQFVYIIIMLNDLNLWSPDVELVLGVNHFHAVLVSFFWTR